MFATVREYLNQYPDTGIDLLTPVGLVKIPPPLWAGSAVPRWRKDEVRRVRSQHQSCCIRFAGTAHLQDRHLPWRSLAGLHANKSAFRAIQEHIPTGTAL